MRHESFLRHLGEHPEADEPTAKATVRWGKLKVETAVMCNYRELVAHLRAEGVPLAFYLGADSFCRAFQTSRVGSKTNLQEV